MGRGTRPFIRSVVPCEPGGCGARIGEKCHAYRDTARHGPASGHETEDVHAARWRLFRAWLAMRERHGEGEAMTVPEREPGMRVYDHHDSPWAVAAEHYLEHALGDVRDGHDALIALSAAEACLRIEAHELPEDKDLLPGEIDPATGDADDCAFC